MKNTLGLIVILGLFAWLYFGDQETQKQPEKTREVSSTSSSKTLEIPTAKKILGSATTELLDQFPGEWKLNSSNGRIDSITGGTFLNAAKNGHSALALMEKLAPLWGIDPSELKLALQQPEHSGRLVSYRIEQRVGGFAVYQGLATVIGNRQTGDGIIVNSSLRDLELNGQTQKISPVEAQQSLVQKFGIANTDANLIRPELVLFEVEPGRGELGFVFEASLKGNAPGKHEIVVSAETGEILYSDSRRTIK